MSQVLLTTEAVSPFTIYLFKCIQKHKIEQGLNKGFNTSLLQVTEMNAMPLSTKTKTA